MDEQRPYQTLAGVCSTPGSTSVENGIALRVDREQGSSEAPGIACAIDRVRVRTTGLSARPEIAGRLLRDPPCFGFVRAPAEIVISKHIEHIEMSW
jgi:hypothetical protein